MNRQTLRDWVHRFNAAGPKGLIDNRTEGPKPRLSEEQLAEFAKIVEAGPDREKDGVVRWRRSSRRRPVHSISNRSQREKTTAPADVLRAARARAKLFRRIVFPQSHR
jgi:Winged helix-turn helix